MSEDSYFEDLEIGQVVQGRSATLTEAQILDFAWQYDPQPFHISKTEAEASHFNGLIASGFQTLGIAFRMVWEESPWKRTSVGGRGIDELRWPNAVRPGDTITSKAEVVEKTPSRSRPFGTVKIRYTAINQEGKDVFSALLIQIIRQRDWTPPED